MAEVDRFKVGRLLVNAADGRDVLEDTGALPDTPLEFPRVLRGVSLQHIKQEVAVEVRDVFRVLDVVGHDIEVEVRLAVGRLQPFMEHAPQDPRTDLTPDRFEKAALLVEKFLPLPAPEKERPDHD